MTWPFDGAPKRADAPSPFPRASRLTPQSRPFDEILASEVHDAVWRPDDDAPRSARTARLPSPRIDGDSAF